MELPGARPVNQPGMFHESNVMAGLKLPSAVMVLWLVSGGVLAFAQGDKAEGTKSSASPSTATPSAATRVSPASPPDAAARSSTAEQSQQPDSPAPSARNDGRAVDESGRPLPVNQAAAHRPPDESLFSPLAAIADVLGISALLSHLGLEEQVASAVGGVLIIALLIVLVFLVWWHLMRRYHVTEMQHRRSRQDRDAGPADTGRPR